MLKAGVSKVCITPPVGVDLSGYAAREQPSTGVLDDLYVRGLYLEEGEERLLWLHADLLGLSRRQVRRLRARMAKEAGWVPRQIVVSATHTHAGPATQRLRSCGEIDAAYLRSLDASLLRAAREAVAGPVRVELGFAEGECRLGVDRRGMPSAHTDTRMPVLAFRRPGGGYVAVIANYAVHNVALSHENRRISADMAGAAARTVRSQLDGAPVTLVANGACGNVNPPRLSADPAVAEAFGRRLGAGITSLARKAVRSPDSRLASLLKPAEVPLDTMTAEEVERVYRQAMSDAPDPWTSAIMPVWRAETLALIARGAAPDHLETDVHAFRIGPASFAALGAEVFSRMADDLRARCGERTYVVGYAGGNIGYVPPREAYAEGGYEVSAYTVYGTFNIAPGGFERLRDESAALLRELGGDHESR